MPYTFMIWLQVYMSTNFVKSKAQETNIGGS